PPGLPRLLIPPGAGGAGAGVKRASPGAQITLYLHISGASSGAPDYCGQLPPPSGGVTVRNLFERRAEVAWAAGLLEQLADDVAVGDRAACRGCRRGGRGRQPGMYVRINVDRHAIRSRGLLACV